MVRENYLWGGTVRVRGEPKNRAELKLEMNQGDLSVAEKAFFGSMFQGEARFGHQNQVVLGDGAFRNDLESLLDEIDERIEPSLLPLEFENHQPLDFVNSLGMAMIGVMPGHYHQGSPEMEEGRDPFHSDEQLREVWLTRPFWMARFPVTQSVWCDLMGEGGCRHQAFRGDRIPAQGMNWHAAMEFCRILTRREAETGRLPAGHEYRLPTEAEWEYACRAGSDCKRSRYDPLELCAVTSESKSGPQEVGGRTPNAWGFHDMLGNVFEWCLDAYAPYRFDQPTDPYQEGEGERVIRGGCFQTPASFARFAARCHVDPSTESGRIGFRVVLASIGWPAGRCGNQP
jgi:formylglycine-generating enzyme required for sulfatase activity